MSCKCSCEYGCKKPDMILYRQGFFAVVQGIDEQRLEELRKVTKMCLWCGVMDALTFAAQEEARHRPDTVKSPLDLRPLDRQDGERVMEAFRYAIFIAQRPAARRTPPRHDHQEFDTSLLRALDLVDERGPRYRN